MSFRRRFIYFFWILATFLQTVKESKRYDNAGKNIKKRYNNQTMKFIQRRIIFVLSVFLLIIFIIFTFPRKIFPEKFRQSYLAWLPGGIMESASTETGLKEEPVFFKIDFSNNFSDFFQGVNLINLNSEDIISRVSLFEAENFSKPRFIFVFKKIEPLNSLEEKIKIGLASSRPEEKQVILPDGTTFIESVIDPQSVSFKSEEIGGIKVRYWQEEGVGGEKRENEGAAVFSEIVIWQDEQYSFVADDLSLIKNMIKEMDSCFSYYLRKKNFNKGVYFIFDKAKLKDLMIIETEKKGLEGCLRASGQLNAE